MTDAEALDLVLYAYGVAPVAPVAPRVSYRRATADPGRYWAPWEHVEPAAGSVPFLPPVAPEAPAALWHPRVRWPAYGYAPPVAVDLAPRPPHRDVRRRRQRTHPALPRRWPVVFDPQPITLHLMSRGLPPTVPFSEMEEF